MNEYQRGVWDAVTYALAGLETNDPNLVITLKGLKEVLEKKANENFYYKITGN